MRGRFLTVRELHVGPCSHAHRTGELLDDGYRQTCDDCGAETTDPAEAVSVLDFIERAAAS